MEICSIFEMVDRYFEYIFKVWPFKFLKNQGLASDIFLLIEASVFSSRY